MSNKSNHHHGGWLKKNKGDGDALTQEAKTRLKTKTTTKRAPFNPFKRKERWAESATFFVLFQDESKCEEYRQNHAHGKRKKKKTKMGQT